jgi:inosine-uridine nucleoside N-ribohydrolase
MTCKILIYLFFFTSSVEFSETKQIKIPLIIDADTANELDDLFAIARAISEPNFNILAINSAQFNNSPLASSNSVMESQLLNKKLASIMKRKDIILPLGSNNKLISNKSPQISEASEFIIKSAHELKKGEKLNLVILGPCTNIASAIIQDPSIISKIKVYYLGIWHNAKTNFYNKKEFNSGNDSIALEVLLNTKDLDFTLMSATTSQKLIFTKDEVKLNFTNNSSLGRLLIERWGNFNRWWTKEDPDKKSWIMWDLALIEAISSPKLALIETFFTPKENLKREIDIYTLIDVNEMKKNFWSKIKSYN